MPSAAGRVVVLHQLCVVLLLLLGAACVFGAKASSSWHFVESDRLSGLETVRYTLALKQRNMDKLEALITQITDPSSPMYTQYMSKEEILDMIAPDVTVRQSILQWLRTSCGNHSFTKILDRGDSILVESTASCAQSLFSIKLGRYAHPEYRSYRPIRLTPNSPTPQLPAHIDQHVEFVTGFAPFFPTRNRKQQLHNLQKTSALGLELEMNSPQADPYHFVIPETCRLSYGIPSGATATNPQNSMCAVEFMPSEAPEEKDLMLFATKAGERFTNISRIVGPWNPGHDVIAWEPLLDVEYLTAIGSNATTWYMTVEGWMYDFATQAFDMRDPPLVFSVSWGYAEEYSCWPLLHPNCSGLTTQQYVIRTNNEFMKMAGRGLSVLACSQDYGAPTQANMLCFNSGKPVSAIFPASSPWVTGVSATTLMKSSALKNPPPICGRHICGNGAGGVELPSTVQNTADQWTTGGGFAEYASRPSYQDAFVTKYLASSAVKPPQQYFNQANRGFPDISALGARILITVGGYIEIEEGTSASTPIIAGLVTLLNDHRLNAGKKPLGFLNPLLYQMAASGTGFRDITNGENNCVQQSTCCTYGYGATTGWDAVTGLGVPNFQQMLDYVMRLP